MYLYLDIYIVIILLFVYIVLYHYYFTIYFFYSVRQRGHFIFYFKYAAFKIIIILRSSSCWGSTCPRSPWTQRGDDAVGAEAVQTLFGRHGVLQHVQTDRTHELIVQRARRHGHLSAVHDGLLERERDRQSDRQTAQAPPPAPSRTPIGPCSRFTNTSPDSRRRLPPDLWACRTYIAGLQTNFFY